MAILCRYIDYRNNEILLHIVIDFCEEELQKRMKNFCELLEEFEIATTVDVYKKAIPNEVNEEVVNGFSEMVVKIDKPESQCTLLEVRKLNKAIIKESTLCSHSVYIGAVSRNCVVVRLRFPSNAVGWVLAAITPDFMTTHRLTEVSVDGHQLSLIQAQRYELVCKLYTLSIRVHLGDSNRLPLCYNGYEFLRYMTEYSDSSGQDHSSKTLAHR